MGGSEVICHITETLVLTHLFAHNNAKQHGEVAPYCSARRQIPNGLFEPTAKAFLHHSNEMHMLKSQLKVLPVLGEP